MSFIQYPEAIVLEKKMKQRGQYKNGWPMGAVVHFTAGHNKPGSAKSMIELGIKNGYTYLAIDSTGQVYQAHSIDRWGYHAGESAWPGIGKGVSDSLIGIEVCCGGKLTKKGDKFFTWFDKEVPKEQVRYSDGKHFQGSAGFYEMFTPKQELALIELLTWLKKSKPDVFKTQFILGHDMVSGKEGIGYDRKNDPGASLSIPIRELQTIIERESKL